MTEKARLDDKSFNKIIITPILYRGRTDSLICSTAGRPARREYMKLCMHDSRTICVLYFTARTDKSDRWSFLLIGASCYPQLDCKKGVCTISNALSLYHCRCKTMLECLHMMSTCGTAFTKSSMQRHRNQGIALPS